MVSYYSIHIDSTYRNNPLSQILVTDLLRPEFGEDFLRSVHPNLSLFHQDFRHSLDLLARCPNLCRDVPVMEVHVDPLDALRSTCSVRGEVWREPHSLAYLFAI